MRGKSDPDYCFNNGQQEAQPYDRQRLADSGCKSYVQIHSQSHHLELTSKSF